MSEATESQTMRWGVIGAGAIATDFVKDLLLPASSHHNRTSKVQHKITAIGSSSLDKAQSFWSRASSGSNTAQFPPKLYDAYSKVYSDPDVDVVYIATPHSFHTSNVLEAIEAGKNILCEKPLTVTAAESELLASKAREKGVFLMEAVWTRFFPLTLKLQSLLHSENAIGKISRLIVDFGLDMPLDEMADDSRCVDRKLGAGALLDIGMYPLTWSGIVFPTALYGEPENVASVLTINKKHGVDEVCTVVLRYKDGAQAVCTASYLCKSSDEFARIEGSEGVIIVEGRAAPRPSALRIRRKGKEEEVVEMDIKGTGFIYEADATAEDILAGRKENETMGLEESVRIMSLMDLVRKQNGFVYPQDE